MTVDRLIIVFFHIKIGVNIGKALEEESILFSVDDLLIGLVVRICFAVFNDLFKITVFGKKLHRCLLADAFDSFVVIGAIACNALEVDNLVRIETKELFEIVLCIADSLAESFFEHFDCDMIGEIQKLKEVFVGGEQSYIIAFVAGIFCHRSCKIISFISFHLIPADIHCIEHFSCNRHLTDQFLRSGRALCLVVFELFLSEGRFSSIEGDIKVVAIIDHGFDFFDEIMKSEDCIDRQSAFCCHDITGVGG